MAAAQDEASNNKEEGEPEWISPSSLLFDELHQSLSIYASAGASVASSAGASTSASASA